MLLMKVPPTNMQIFGSRQLFIPILICSVDWTSSVYSTNIWSVGALFIYFSAEKYLLYESFFNVQNEQDIKVDVTDIIILVTHSYLDRQKCI